MRHMGKKINNSKDQVSQQGLLLLGNYVITEVTMYLLDSFDMIRNEEDNFN